MGAADCQQHMAGGQRLSGTRRAGALRNRLIAGLSQIPDAVLNGDPENRLPGNVNFSFFPAYRADLGDGLNGANLIVGIHDGHKAGVLPDGPCGTGGGPPPR